MLSMLALEGGYKLALLRCDRVGPQVVALHVDYTNRPESGAEARAGPSPGGGVAVAVAGGGGHGRWVSTVGW